MCTTIKKCERIRTSDVGNHAHLRYICSAINPRKKPRKKKTMIPVVFLTILGLAYLILVVSAVVVVVLDNHNPMRAMSWVVVLLFLPVVGLVLYVFFGRNLRREHLIGKRTLSRISRKSLQAYIEQRSIQTPRPTPSSSTSSAHSTRRSLRGQPDDALLRRIYDGAGAHARHLTCTTPHPSRVLHLRG